jgi:hypothetical protein
MREPAVSASAVAASLSFGRGTTLGGTVAQAQLLLSAMGTAATATGGRPF